MSHLLSHFPVGSGSLVSPPPEGWSPAGTEALAAINRSAIAPGETLPVVTLADGTRVQTGTVATLLRTIADYDAAVAAGVEAVALETLESRLAAAVPTLLHIGLFGLFPPSEWQAGASAGRRWVGDVAAALLADAVDG